MKNNGMIEYKESFISKIKNFLKNLFGKKEEQNSYSYQENIDEIKQEKIEEEHELDSNQNQFISNIKVDSNVNNAHCICDFDIYNLQRCKQKINPSQPDGFISFLNTKGNRLSVTLL